CARIGLDHYSDIFDW
nr:immunoglobulin heavy chain junction region [Macaca mulatta]MOV49224.1 immunoglobulin heavy chain junction region [Macaca mulatta]MOV49267.1 immunoglobulin heavy chain junction region [Macaca mulatta]MOV49897.1 immunoglobulin heavy chain junction region [Macaca mulatta]